MTAAEAFLLQLTRKGLQGDSSAARTSLQAIEAACAKYSRQGPTIDVITICFITFGVGSVLATLGMGIKRNRLDKARVRGELNPWIIEAALARLGNKALTAEEQREVWRAARTPEKVQWPDWWQMRGVRGQTLPTPSGHSQT